MASGVLPTQRSRVRTRENRAATRMAAWAPYVFAIFFSIWALRGVTTTDVVDTDAARHAMNGAFIYDVVRAGQIQHAGQYGMWYYGHLPAISMPYHPPMFPLIEAVFFAMFGVKLFTARLAVAVTVGICTFLLYRLTQATSNSHALAACATITTMSLTTFQLVATEVMLEFPAFAFILAALWVLRDLDPFFSAGRALLFAALSAAAMWTKQHAVFLGAMPVIYALLSGRSRLLLRKPIWISIGVFSASALALLILSLHFNGVGLDQAGIASQHVWWGLGIVINVRRYAAWMGDNAIGLPGLFAVCSVVAYLWGVLLRGRQNLGSSLYLAWILLVVPLLLVTAGNIRYLFFLLPPVIVFGYAMLFRGCACLWGERHAWYVPAAFAVAWFVTGLMFTPEFLRGPGAAAAAVVRGVPARVVYTGEADGNFIFAVRSLDPKLETIVISGEKLKSETFEAAAFERFCLQYGIDWIVMEEGTKVHKWSALQTSAPRSMKLERTIPLESNRTRWQHGEIRIYRFIAPAGQHPGGVVDLPVPKIHRTIGVHL